MRGIPVMEPVIILTQVPDYGETLNLKGRVDGIPNYWDYALTCHLYMNGIWWGRPYSNHLLTFLDPDYNFEIDVTTAPNDEKAEEIILALVSKDYQVEEHRPPSPEESIIAILIERTPTRIRIITPTPSPTLTPTLTVAPSPTLTSTPTETSSPTATMTSTSTPTPTPTSTFTPRPTATATTINNPPVALDQFLSLPYQGEVVFNLGASDPDGDSLRYILTTSPLSGILLGIPPSLIYRPNDGFFGQDSFTFVVNDGKLNSNTATVFITVEQPFTPSPTSTMTATMTPVPSLTSTPTPIPTATPTLTSTPTSVPTSTPTPETNNPPVATDGNYQTNFQTYVNITLQASDVDGDALSYVLETSP
ncbi:MAG: hypothetical protein HY507_02380, partial [Candidatus Zambryskibacteria bacterium]|nr:hypothetical protein [Candidatus Zambryskibacteria bacterium]